MTNYQEIIKQWISRNSSNPSFNEFLKFIENYSSKPCHSISDIKNNRNTKVKGDLFENFCKLYLLTLYGIEYSNVWIINEVPAEIRESLHLRKQDFGIDLICQLKDGDFDAVQCKYRKRNNRSKCGLGWKDLSTFFALVNRSGPWRKYIVMTNLDYVRHIGKKNKKDLSICYQSFNSIKHFEWLSMIDKKNEIYQNIESINNVSNSKPLGKGYFLSCPNNDLPKTSEELRKKRLNFLNRFEKKKVKNENELMNKWSNILVNRKGDLNDSTMITNKVLMEIESDSVYKLVDNNLIKYESLIDKNDKVKSVQIDYLENSNSGSDLKFVDLDGIWIDTIDNIKGYNTHNILGDNGELLLNRGIIEIPEAKLTDDNLEYYNCKLCKDGDLIKFGKNMPLTEMIVGKNYVDGFIYPFGDGVYLEYHNTPHFHKPINNECEGFLIIGKKIGDKIRCSAFKVSYPNAVLMSPYVIHNDCFLVGKWLVMYNMASEYSTVNLFYQNNYERKKVKVLINEN